MTQLIKMFERRFDELDNKFEKKFEMFEKK